ncbi:MAG: GGDEF domain-containing protein, partial [Candidatus Obscuribacterales bacterium]|nr:GGDEF domain-containing protein [Candidatus Obscuribacterales bacterium]
MNNFFIRLLIVVLVGFFVVTGASNAIFPSMTASHQDHIAKMLADKLAKKAVTTTTDAPDTPAPPPVKGKKKKGKGQPPPAADTKPAPEVKVSFTKDSLPSILETLAEHHLSWYYLSDTQGKPLPLTKPFAPDLATYEENSRRLDWRGQQYYESVAKVTDGYNLHVGFYSGPPVGLSRDLVEEEIPFMVSFALWSLTVVAIIILYVFSITLPLRKMLAHFKRKASDSGMTVGNLVLPGATQEVYDVRKLIEEKNQLLEERDNTIRDRDNVIKKLNSQFDQEMSAAKKEKTVLYLKEAENQFVDRISGSLDSHTSTTGIGDAVLGQLQSEFPNSFEFALFFTISKKQDANLVSHIGFQNNPLEVYKGLGMMRGLQDNETDVCTVIEPSQIVEPQFREIAELTGSRYVIYSPMRFQGRRLALMVVFFRGQDQSLEHITRVLNRASNVTAKSLHHIMMYEEQVEAARTDELTGFPNKAYLPHLLPQLMEQVEGFEGERRPFSIFLVEGHDVLAINEKYGRPAGDTVIQELGKRIDRLLQQRRTETMGSWGDHLIRYQGAQFLVILRQVDVKKATIFAQRLRQVLEGEDFPCGVGRWSVGIGITSYPEDSTS